MCVNYRNDGVALWREMVYARVVLFFLTGSGAVFNIYRYARSERIKQLAQKNQKW